MEGAMQRHFSNRGWSPAGGDCCQNAGWSRAGCTIGSYRPRCPAGQIRTEVHEGNGND